MQLSHPGGERRIRHSPDRRLYKGSVEREIDLGNAGCGREAAIVFRIIPAHRQDIIKRPRLAAHDPIADAKVAVGRVLRYLLESRLVETWRQRVDQVDIARELAVLFPGYARRDEDSEMADAVVNG